MPDPTPVPSGAPLRVALFTGAYNHIADGVSLTLNRTVRYLLAQGIDVRVFAPTVGAPPVQHAGTLVPVPSVAIPGRPEYRFSLGFTRGARRAAEAFAPDLVHIATPDLLGHGALRWAERRGVPVVASYHTHFASYLDFYGLGRFEGLMWARLARFYRRCAHVYVPSASMMDVLRAHGIDGNLRLWTRGVETDRFNPARRSDAWRAERGFAPSDVVVAYVGRLVAEKGLDVFAGVVEGLCARGLGARTLVVGDGPVRAALEARLPDAVFTGHLGGTDLAVAHASADVFVFPSETETFGNVTLEAMASGVPTVCADATGSASLVADGETGFLCPPRSIPAFTDAVARLVADADLRGGMGRAAFARAASYSWPAVLGTLVRYYEEVTGRRLREDGDARSHDGFSKHEDAGHTHPATPATAGASR